MGEIGDGMGTRLSGGWRRGACVCFNQDGRARGRLGRHDAGHWSLDAGRWTDGACSFGLATPKRCGWGEKKRYRGTVVLRDTSTLPAACGGEGGSRDEGWRTSRGSGGPPGAVATPRFGVGEEGPPEGGRKPADRGPKGVGGIGGTLEKWKNSCVESRPSTIHGSTTQEVTHLPQRGGRWEPGPFRCPPRVRRGIERRQKRGREVRGPGDGRTSGDRSRRHQRNSHLHGGLRGRSICPLAPQVSGGPGIGVPAL
ncbi:hypothetical protein QBC39DRAFT_12725 [Podospora conica]|nr:hypothetical protein QBC39DRAFT_12725 [Schizothecium conicum]